MASHRNNEQSMVRNVSRAPTLSCGQGSGVFRNHRTQRSLMRSHLWYWSCCHAESGEKTSVQTFVIAVTEHRSQRKAISWVSLLEHFASWWSFWVYLIKRISRICFIYSLWWDVSFHTVQITQIIIFLLIGNSIVFQSIPQMLSCPQWSLIEMNLEWND